MLGYAAATGSTDQGSGARIPTACSSTVVSSGAAQFAKPLLHLLPGVSHAVSTIAVGYPFDTVKTRLQLRLHPRMLSCAQEVLRSEGPLAFYRGAAMPLVSLTCKRPFEFAFFEWFKRRFDHVRGVSFIGGCFAGVIGAAIGCPFSVVKIQMQAHGRDVHPNTAHAIRAVYASSGFAGFYRGLSASIIVSVPYATVYLGTYGKLRDTFPKTAWSTAAAGGIASITTCTLLQPLDTVRTMIQAKAKEMRTARTTSWPTQVSLVVREHGMLGLWAGWGPAALRSFPTSAASMLAYEWSRSLVDNA